MEKISKGLFKEIMVFVKQFEALGNKWCEEEDLASIAQARSYGKKIISAMKPFIESSIRETEAAIAAEAAKLATPVIEETKVPEVPELVVEVATVESTPVTEETISAEIIAEAPVVEIPKVEEVVEAAPEVVEAPVEESKPKSTSNYSFLNKKKPYNK